MPLTTTPIPPAPGVLRALLDWPEGEGAGRVARRHLTDWSATDPVLRRWQTPGQLVRSVRADATLLDPVLGPVAAHRGDPVATTTVLSALAPRLAGIIGRARRAGTTGVDAEGFEADLVAEVVALLSAPVPVAPDRLVGRAWQAARDRRRTERRRATRLVPLADDLPGPSCSPPNSVDGVVGMLELATRSGVVPPDHAAALYRTALGIPTLDQAVTAGCTTGAIRARRSRAARRLATWADC
jgi:hypothetical protein